MNKEPARFDARTFLASLRPGPGVYRMYDEAGHLIYVGKAKDVRRRLSSYFQRSPDSPKTQAMLKRLGSIEVTRTSSEVEALLLESNLIKQYKPRYNVVFRDDKSYPYIRVTDSLDYPRLSFYRGRRREKGRYFGPYPSAAAARATLGELQRVFKLRNCTDSFFRNRTRPCLQFQIERCSAPCVGYVKSDDYRADFAHAIAFLEGRDEFVIDELVQKMDEASRQLDFERAAALRDQIRRLRQIRARQHVIRNGGTADVFALAMEGEMCVVTRLQLRAGQVVSTEQYLPRVGGIPVNKAMVLETFISQYYLDHPAPPRLIVSRPLPKNSMLEQALRRQTRRELAVVTAKRGTPLRLAQMAQTNADESLRQKLAGEGQSARRVTALERTLSARPGTLARIECFDISHTQGEAPVASCVVFENGRPKKQDYRRFNLRDAPPGDDVAALAEAIERRYRRVKEEGAKLPDIVLIDGGKAQVMKAGTVLRQLDVSVPRLVGIVKGFGRRPEFDSLIVGPSGERLRLASSSPALHLLQAARDEAHRFALSGHRHRRTRSRQTSILDAVEGVGPIRRRELLRRFGGLKGIARASREDLQAVHGISRALAGRIFEHLHSRQQ